MSDLIPGKITVKQILNNYADRVVWVKDFKKYTMIQMDCKRIKLMK